MIIDQDIHLHTHLSLCARRDAFLDGYIRGGKKNGLSVIGISNHFWDESIPDAPAPDFYNPQNYAHICEDKPVIAENRNCGLRILFGAETEYSFQHRCPAITAEIAGKLDFLLVPNSHTHITMPKEYYPDHQKHADYMLQAFLDIVRSPVAPYITAIAHPFHAVCCPYDHNLLIPLISDSSFKECFCTAAEKGIAMELNTSCFAKMTLGEIRQSPYLRMFRIAKDCRCKFTFGTDAHAEEETESLAKGYVLGSLLNLTDSDIKRI